MLSPLSPADQNQISKQCARLLRRRKDDLLSVPQNRDFAEQPDLQMAFHPDA
jgi:hypothetical protein